MPVDNAAKAVGELREIRRSIDDLARLIKTFTKPPTPYTRPSLAFPDVLAEVPVTLDWVTPAIKGMAHIVNDNGRVKITIVVDEDRTEQTTELVRKLEIGSLHISAMADPE